MAAATGYTNQKDDHFCINTKSLSSMKKFYIVCIPVLLLLFTACKKDKQSSPIENLLTSRNWQLWQYRNLYYTNSSGFFTGTLSFRKGGLARYTDSIGQVYTGMWE